MKLEVGMYVRTDKGYIGEITYCRESAEMVSTDIDKEYLDVDYGYGISFREIIISSHNIIDLIEVGDYANGIRVGYINKGENYFYALADENTIEIICGYDSDGFTKPLKSIVTKEQMEAMAYKVVE